MHVLKVLQACLRQPASCLSASLTATLFLEQPLSMLTKDDRVADVITRGSTKPRRTEHAQPLRKRKDRRTAGRPFMATSLPQGHLAQVIHQVRANGAFQFIGPTALRDRLCMPSSHPRCRSGASFQFALVGQSVAIIHRWQLLSRGPGKRQLRVAVQGRG